MTDGVGGGDWGMLGPSLASFKNCFFYDFERVWDFV